ncbi:MAG: GNAT family N-acetyltransferase [Deltaproteobacteria bacterium]|nr:GNAT family N-acetyltransferase [Deltaproteobacteria bacterium]
MTAGIVVREATEADVPGVRAIFEATYEHDYPYRSVFEESWLKRAVFNDSMLMLVAEEMVTGELLGTASVVFDISSQSDLTGEFGRLAVPPRARGRGIGKLLMGERIAFVRRRLHAAVVDNRTTHPFSQKVSERHGLSCVGFLPKKYKFTERESIAFFGLLFPEGLALRCNHPRVVPEAQALAHIALSRCGVAVDVIVDEDSPAYVADVPSLVVEQLTADATPALLRIQRGRVRRREIFGPIRLQHGFFMLEAHDAGYLIARDAADDGTPGAVAGAIGFVHHPDDGTVQVFELIARSDGVVRFLWDELMARCRAWGVVYAEADVSAHAPRMQRTLLELGFLPVAYVPAGVFVEVERLDIVRMARLDCAPPRLEDLALTPHCRTVAELVLRAFEQRAVLPRVDAAMGSMSLFRGLSPEQRRRLAGAFDVVEAEAGTVLYREGDPPRRLYALLAGTVSVQVGDRVVGAVGAGDCFGELSLLTGEPHSAEVAVSEDAVAAVLSAAELAQLTRSRPDIAVRLYRNLAVDVGRKLQRSNAGLVET